MELWAVFSAVQTFSYSIEETQGAGVVRLIILCDNKSVCDVLSSMKSDDDIMSKLICDLVEVIRGRINLRVCHIDGVRNPADWLTKGAEALLEFRRRFPIKRLSLSPHLRLMCQTPTNM
jgi:hypothetical protein